MQQTGLLIASASRMTEPCAQELLGIHHFELARVLLGLDQMAQDVNLDHFGREPGQGAAHAGDELQDFRDEADALARWPSAGRAGS